MIYSLFSKTVLDMHARSLAQTPFSRNFVESSIDDNVQYGQQLMVKEPRVV
jgi:hypothetical protein